MNFNISENVKGTNLLREALRNELAKLLPQLEKHVGNKITTLSGRSAKFKIEHLDQQNFRCWLDISSYSIWLKADYVTTSAPDKNGVCTASYWKDSIYLGKMENGVLGQIEPQTSHIQGVIDESEVLQQIAAYKELSAQIDKIKSAFPLNTDLLKY